MTANTIYMSGKPRFTYGDLVEFRGIIISYTSKNPQKKNLIEESPYLIAWGEPKGLNDSDEIFVKRTYHGRGVNDAKSFRTRLFSIKSGINTEKMTSYDLLKHINSILDTSYVFGQSIKVSLISRDYTVVDEICIYNKHKHADATKRNWEKAARLSKPSKMESKKMYNKKSSTQKSPVKRMTGNIEVLGENFKKLI